MRRALLIGINHYRKAPLKGCIKDAERMSEVLSKNQDGSPNFDCKLLISKEEAEVITAPFLKKNIYDLLNHEAEVALLYFSGHGSATVTGSYLVTQDHKKFGEGVSLSEVITMANNSKALEVVIILDCCHSGGVGNFLETGERKVLLREGVSILASSRDTQYSVERNGLGLFTTVIYNALLGGATDILGKINVSNIYNYIDLLFNSWEQRPVFKSHVSKMISLRSVTPKIPIGILRKLPEYFLTKEDPFPLSPSYDESLGGENKELLEIMRHLQLYNINGLLLPINPLISLLETARNSESCKLTALGQYYWELTKKNQI